MTYSVLYPQGEKRDPLRDQSVIDINVWAQPGRK